MTNNEKEARRLIRRVLKVKDKKIVIHQIRPCQFGIDSIFFSTKDYTYYVRFGISCNTFDILETNREFGLTVFYTNKDWWFRV